MHEPEVRYVYVDRPSLVAQLAVGLVGMVLRWVVVFALAVCLFVGATVGFLWLLGKGVEALPDTGTTTTTTTGR